MFQISLTVAAGKKLISRATVLHPALQQALKNGTVVVIAGSTNGYIAHELLIRSNQSGDFQQNRFFRGVSLPPEIKTTDTGRLPQESQFPGDVIFVNGVWHKGKTIFDVINDLREGDIIVKGANCLNLPQKKAGILIGHPQGGTIAAALQAVVGKRVRLLLPVGLEKRVFDDMDSIAKTLNTPGATGPRLLPVIGEVITEIDAVYMLSGAKATLVAAGGVCGAEGAVWLAVEGTEEQMEKAHSILQEIIHEPPFLL